MSLITRENNGGPLSINQMDSNFLYLEQIILNGVTGSVGAGVTGPAGPMGPAGATGPAGSGGSGMVEVTKLEIDNLINTNTLVPGTLYKITGVCKSVPEGDFPSKILYDDGTNSGTTIYLTAISTNKLSSTGYGEFWNPKYNKQIEGYGIYCDKLTANMTVTGALFYGNEQVVSNTGATGQLLGPFNSKVIRPGATSSAWIGSTSITMVGNPSVTANISSIKDLRSVSTIGSKVIWGGYVWVNTTGLLGSAPYNYSLSSDWSKVTYNDTDYNFVIDEIEYDYKNDWMCKRREAIGNNEVSFTWDEQQNMWWTINPIAMFQFGNPLDVEDTYFGLMNNIVKNSFFETVNFRGRYLENNKITDSTIRNIFFDASSMSYNNISLSSWRYLSLVSSSRIGGNTINQSTLYTIDMSSGSISNNVSLLSLTLSSVSFGQANFESNNIISDFTLQHVDMTNTSFNYCNVPTRSAFYGALGDRLRFTSKSIYYVTFDNARYMMNSFGQLDTSTAMFNNNVAKTVYNRPDQTVRVRWYDDTNVLVNKSINE